MKAGGGHSKGGAFEREVSRKLSLWLSNGQRSDLLWRSSMSGGRATLEFKAGRINLTQSGDLTAIAQEAFDFCEKNFVECKNYQDLRIGRSMVCGTGELIAFWKTAVRESVKYDKRPILIAHQNRYPTIAITDMIEPLLWSNPIITLHQWNAFVYDFDEVTRVRRPFKRGN